MKPFAKSGGRRTFVISIVLIVCMLAIGFTACGGGGAGAADGEKNVLRVGTTHFLGGFNPNSPDISLLGSYLVYETIERRDGDGYLASWLADCGWVDDSHYEIKMKEGITFSNGEEMTGEDILWSFRIVAESPAPWASYYSTIDFDASTVSEDGRTVTFVFTAPYAPFNSFTDTPAILDKSAVEDWATDDARWWDQPVGSGPYTVVENISGSQIKFALRDDYWSEEYMPEWDEIILNEYADSSSMFVAFENNEIDLMLDPANADMERMINGGVNGEDNQYELIQKASNITLYLDGSKPELQDLKVREAIANAIDPDAVGTATFGTLYRVADSVLSPECKFYTSVGAYTGGIEYAKQCMADSGYPDGFTLHAVVALEDEKSMAVIQEQLAQIGIETKIDIYDASVVIETMMKEGGADASIQSEVGGNYAREPIVDLMMTRSEVQYTTRIMDPEYIEHYNAALNTNSDEVRAEEYDWIQHWLHDNAMLIPIVDQAKGYAWHGNVVADADFYSVQKADLLLVKAA